jgi:hypothetical protein
MDVSLNALLSKVVDTLYNAVGGINFVDGFQQAYDNHRFCEVEADASYHKRPIEARTWFIHYDSPYENPSVTGHGNGSFFDQVDSVLIPPKNGQSTADQIKAVDGNLAKINPAYNDMDSMTAALTKLAKDDATYSWLPMAFLRVMHPKGSGYKPMSDAVIDAVLKYGAAGAGGSGDGGSPGTQSPGLMCTTGANGNNKFLARDDLNNQIGIFCDVAAQQGVQDHDSGSIVRTYNQGQRYEVILAMDWPSGQDIRQNMKQNCIDSMTLIMDSESPVII